MLFQRNSRQHSIKHTLARSLRVEKLEDRRVLAIIWANEFGTGIDAPHFNNYAANETIARQIVNRAIDDWNAIITDQNFDNDNNPATHDFALKVFEGQLGVGGRGQTSIDHVTTGGTAGGTGS